MNRTTRYILLVLIILIMIVTPLIFVKDAEFGGSDGQAGDVIVEIDPDYEPWFNPFIEPASGEIESLLFSLQAAMGAGFIGYFFGFVRGKRSAAKSNSDDIKI